MKKNSTYAISSLVLVLFVSLSFLFSTSGMGSANSSASWYPGMIVAGNSQPVQPEPQIIVPSSMRRTISPAAQEERKVLNEKKIIKDKKKRRAPAALRKNKTRKLTGEIPYEHIISKASSKHKVRFELIAGVMKRESNFDKKAISPTGAQGLMQLKPETARDMNVKDVFDPHDNTMGGAKYLAFLSKIFNNDLDMILLGYLRGPDGARDEVRCGLQEDAKRYLKSVKDNISYYEAKRNRVLAMK